MMNEFGTVHSWDYSDGLSRQVDCPFYNSNNDTQVGKIDRVIR